MDLTPEQLLRLVLQEYIETAAPVGSQYLVNRYTLGISPATVRNWFAELDELGLLEQPHTSGGRIPTEAAFKQYVEQGLVPKPAGKRSRERLVAAAALRDERLKALAKELSDLTGLAAIVATNGDDTFYTGLSKLLEQPEFRDWQSVLHLTKLLDQLDQTLAGLGRIRFDEPLVLLGKDCPFGPDCSLLVAKSRHGELLGLLGPIRMEYQEAMSHLISALDALNS
jgi:heat-inducible transcriptional repressor